MSDWLSFYRIRKPDGLPSGTVNVDEREDVSWVEASKTKDWQKKLGVRRTIRRNRLDLFDAAEKEFGERPMSLFRRPYESTGTKCNYIFTMADGTTRDVPDVVLEKYRKEEILVAYLYVQESVSDVKRPYVLEDCEKYDNREITEDDFEKMIEDCLKNEASDDLLEIMKARKAFRNGNAVVAFLD